MPSLANHPSTEIVKMLVVGDSGVGKTGGLASLVDAGYKLRVIDFEAGLDPLAGFVKKRELLDNVSYHTLKDEYKISGSTVALSKAPSFQRAMSLLNKWETDDGDLGSVSSWGPDTVLVIDALSSMGRASLNMVLQANGQLMKPPELQHWGMAMDNIEKVLGNLTNPKMVPCHVIVLTHVTAQEQEGGGLVKLYPEALGTKLNPKVGRYFNNLLSLSITAGEKTYKTQKDGMLACKTSRPVKDKYPLATGMADLFSDLLKK